MVELKILARIQEEVGFGIKIQDLFDLVIGTSTGMSLLIFFATPGVNANV